MIRRLAALVVVVSLALSGSVATAGAGTGDMDDGLGEITTAPTFHQPHAEILRLYFALFDRPPDLDGARYWIGLYDAGETIEAIAAHMSAAPEFAQRYGDTSIERYVTALYANVLGREPDPEGFAYWVELLSSRRSSRLDVLQYFAAGSEFADDHRFEGEEHARPGPPLTRPVGSGGPIITVSVEVEAGLGWSILEIEEEVVAILGDGRSWVATGTRRFQLVRDEPADVRIRLATPATVDARCWPLRTVGRLSCRNGSALNINSDRWAGATSFWTASLGEYRAYVINHEMGHFLGLGHQNCPGRGRPAPVMQQQTLSLQGCQPNGWPYPNG